MIWASRLEIVRESRESPSSEVLTFSGLSRKASASTVKDFASWSVSICATVPPRSVKTATTSNAGAVRVSGISVTGLIVSSPAGSRARNFWPRIVRTLMAAAVLVPKRDRRCPP